MNKKILFSIILVMLLLTPTTIMADTTESCPSCTVQKHIETVNVSSNGSTITSTNVLESGVTYLLEASGTYRFANWGDYGIADAEWAYRNDGFKDDPIAPHGWTLGENTYPSVLGLDVLVDGQNVFWGDFNPEHVYTILLNGTGSEVNFNIYDSAYGDNSGSLTVNISECEDHKIKNKWDLNGSFVAHPRYDWGGLKEGATWDYSIHIKEAKNGDFSVGSIRFTSGDVKVVGHVKQTKADYGYWSKPNLAAAGTSVYNGKKYNFLFLYSNKAIWFAISTESLEPYWTGQTVWGGSKRAYQLHSVHYGTPIMDPKIIHE